MLSEIKTFYDLVPDSFITQLMKSTIYSKRWQFDFEEYPDKRKKIVGLCIDGELNPFKHTVQLLSNFCNCTFELLEVKIHSQFFGTMQENPIYDSSENDRYTLLLNLNKKFNIQDGGQFVFYDKYIETDTKDTKILSDCYSIFIPDRRLTILYPSNTYHFSFGLSQNSYKVKLFAKLILLKKQSKSPYAIKILGDSIAG